MILWTNCSICSPYCCITYSFAMLLDDASIPSFPVTTFMLTIASMINRITMMIKAINVIPSCFWVQLINPLKASFLVSICSSLVSLIYLDNIQTYNFLMSEQHEIYIFSCVPIQENVIHFVHTFSRKVPQRLSKNYIFHTVQTLDCSTLNIISREYFFEIVGY